MNFLRKYWLLFLLALTAALLLFFYLQARGQPRQPEERLQTLSYPVLSGQDIPISAVIDIQADVADAQGFVYQVEPAALSEERASEIAQKLGFAAVPSRTTSGFLGQSYIWLASTQTLSIRLSPVEILLATETDIAPPPPTEGALPPQEQAINSLQATLAKLGLSPAQLGTVRSQPKTDPTGNFIEVGLTPTINGTIVVDHIFTPPMISANFQKDAKMASFYYRVAFGNPRQGINYPIKTKEDIRQSIVKEGKIVSVDREAEVTIAITPSKITIDKIVSASLFFFEKPTTLFPIYVLAARATTPEGEIPVVIYLPSVKSQYLESR